MSIIAPFAFRQEIISLVPEPTGAAVFPQWNQNFTSELATDYFIALDALSGSTNQQMQDMEWGLTASLVATNTRDYEAGVVMDGYIIAYDFTRQYILKIDTEANTVTEVNLGSAQITSRARAGFHPSGSDSVFFVNRDDQLLRYRPSDDFVETFTSSSSDSVTGPTGLAITFDWKAYNPANSNSAGGKNSIWSIDGNNSASMELYYFTGSFQGRCGTTDNHTGLPIFHSFNDTNPALTIIGDELVTTGSSAGYTTNTIFGDTAEIVPYYSGSNALSPGGWTKGNDDETMVLVSTTDGWNANLNQGAYGLWRDNQYYGTDATDTGGVRIRTTTIGPDGQIYASDEQVSNGFVIYNWKNNDITKITISGDTIAGSNNDFSHRIYTATNGAMYLIPFINGTNVYRISPPLTGSDAANIKNMALSLFTNNG